MRQENLGPLLKISSISIHIQQVITKSNITHSRRIYENWSKTRLENRHDIHTPPFRNDVVHGLKAVEDRKKKLFIDTFI